VRSLQILLTLFGALAVLSLGAFGAVAAPRDVAPCHQQSDHHRSPEKTPTVMKAMICCVACVAPLDFEPAETPSLAVPPRRQPVSSSVPAGRLPSPDHGPPRLLIA
jgi:hypothetical protein